MLRPSDLPVHVSRAGYVGHVDQDGDEYVVRIWDRADGALLVERRGQRSQWEAGDCMRREIRRLKKR